MIITHVTLKQSRKCTGTNDHFRRPITHSSGRYVSTSMILFQLHFGFLSCTLVAAHCSVHLACPVSFVLLVTCFLTIMQHLYRLVCRLSFLPTSCYTKLSQCKQTTQNQSLRLYDTATMFVVGSESTVIKALSRVAINSTSSIKCASQVHKGSISGSF